MSKITAPFLSLEATGTLGKVLTSYRNSGRPYMIFAKKRRVSVVQSLTGFGRIYFAGSYFGYQGKYNAKTKSQQQGMQRIIFSNAWKAWKLLTTIQKNEYIERAKNIHMTGPNLFMKEFYTT